MNKQKWLIVGLSLAMAATLGVGISACGGEKEHTHTYDTWDYNETQHWKYCDEHGTDKSNIDETTKANHSFGQDGKCECGYDEPHTHNYMWYTRDPLEHWKVCSEDNAIDESTRANHSFNAEGVCECGAVRWEMYVVGKITSYPGSMIPSLYSKQGLNISEEVPKNCPKMTLSEDGTTYTAEVNLIPTDYFGVYSLTTGAEYPRGLSLASKGPTSETLQVEKAGIYLISWEIGAERPTVRVHDHKYTDYQYDDTQHWKVCPSDGAVDPDYPKTNHVYDQPDNKCICGAVETVSCEHSNGYAFDYEVLPAVEADGGTLQWNCLDCGAPQDVTYSKGFTGDGVTLSAPGTIGDISEEGTYYFTTGNKYQTLGMKITEAGTYTLTFEEVCDLNGKNSKDGQLGISGLTFGTAYASAFSRTANSLIYDGLVTSKSAVSAQFKDYAVKVNGKDVRANTSDDLCGNLVTFSFTVTDKQLQAGDLYVTIHLGGYTDTGHLEANLTVADSLSHLVTVTKSAAETISAPAEVALLPGKED